MNYSLTHPTFLLASSSEMRLDRVQVDLWHRRLDVVNVEAAFNNTSNVKRVRRIFSQRGKRRDSDATETVERKPMSAGCACYTYACNLECSAKIHGLSRSAIYFSRGSNKYKHLKKKKKTFLCLIRRKFLRDWSNRFCSPRLHLDKIISTKDWSSRFHSPFASHCRHRVSIYKTDWIVFTRHLCVRYNKLNLCAWI